MRQTFEKGKYLERRDGSVHIDVGCETVLSDIDEVGRLHFTVHCIHTLYRVRFVAFRYITETKTHISQPFLK